MVPYWPIFKALSAFKVPKLLNMGSFHLFVHPKWSRTIF